jgi:hypothetical protein
MPAAPAAGAPAAYPNPFDPNMFLQMFNPAAFVPQPAPAPAAAPAAEPAK